MTPERNRFTLPAAALTVLLPFLPGCAREHTSAPGLEAVIETIDGVEHLRYPETGAPQLSWRFDTVAVIGGANETDRDKQFGQIFGLGMTTGSDGSLYVLDTEGKRIIAYRHTGDVAGTWGREGQGPGEIGTWGGMLAMGPGDTLWLADGANQRFTLFPTDGGKATSIPLPSGATGYGGGLAPTAEGVLSLMTMNSIAPASGGGASLLPLLHIARNGAVVDTILTVAPPVTDLVSIQTGNRTMMIGMPRQFYPKFSFARFGDGGLVFQSKADYELQLLTVEGTVERVVRRDPPPRPTTEEDKQRVIDRMLEPRDGQVSEVQRKRAEATTFSDVIPTINEMVLDHADRIWVGVSRAVPGETERLDIYSRDGELVGELHNVEMPDRFFGDGYAALITTDELDVEQIVILKLVEVT